MRNIFHLLVFLVLKDKLVCFLFKHIFLIFNWSFPLFQLSRTEIGSCPKAAILCWDKLGRMGEDRQLLEKLTPPKFPWKKGKKSSNIAHWRNPIIRADAKIIVAIRQLPFHLKMCVWNIFADMPQPSECGRQRTLNIVHAQTAAQRAAV